MMDAESSKTDTLCNISVADVEILRWKNLIRKNDKCRAVAKKYKVVRKTDVEKLLHKVNVKKCIHYLTEDNSKYKSTKGIDRLDELLKCKENQEGTINNELKYEPYKPPVAFVDPGFEKRELKVSNETAVCDIRRRIYIPKTNLDSIKGITDVDEKYFTIVKKDPTKSKLGLRKYINYLRDSLRLRLQTGYIFDEIYKLREQSDIERAKIDEVQAKLKDYKTSFNEFLAEDHNQSMKPLLHYQEKLAETDKKRKILKEKMIEVSKLQFHIYSLEDSWQKSKLCEEFILSFFSILSGNDRYYYYNMKYGIKHDPSQLDQIDDAGSFMSLLQFTTPKIVNKGLDISLNDPALLIEIFTSLEHQCLDYLMFTEVLEKPNTTISLHLNAITNMYNDEISTVLQTVTRLTNVIAFIEQNNESLQSRISLLINGLYKATFEGAEESIVINEYLKQTYIRCITGSEASVSSQQMMNALALEYSQLLLEMDSVPSHLVRKRVKEVENREALKLKVARNAQRRIHELEILTQQMSRVFDPIPEKGRRKLMYRSFRPVVNKKHVVVPEQMTEEEKEYLYLFTEFCSFTDNPKDFLPERKEIRKDSTPKQLFIMLSS